MAIAHRRAAAAAAITNTIASLAPAIRRGLGLPVLLLLLRPLRRHQLAMVNFTTNITMVGDNSTGATTSRRLLQLPRRGNGGLHLLVHEGARIDMPSTLLADSQNISTKLLLEV